MPYTLKPSDELNQLNQQRASEKEMYGDKDWNPEQGLPEIKDMAAVSTASRTRTQSKSLGIVYKLIGILLIAAVAFGVYLGLKYLIDSGGNDISSYLAYTELEISDMLGIKFEQHDELAPRIQQYSDGKVTVREGEGLQIVYIDGVKVGVCTDSRKYRFFGVGINDADKDVQDLMTFKKNDSFVVLNDLMGGSSTSYYYMDRAGNTCLVITVNEKSNRVVFMSYFTDLEVITKNLSF